MTLTNLFNRFRREPTPDEVLASNLRDAIEGYNKAMAAARDAGLSTMIYGQYSKHGLCDKYVGSDYRLRLSYISRNSTKEL